MVALKENIGFIGGGNMAFAIALGLINRNVIQPNQILTSGPHIENLERWTKMGTSITVDNYEVVEKCDIIFLCVKPKILESCCKDLYKSSCNKLSIAAVDKIFLSVLAGVTLEQLEKSLKFYSDLNVKIIRTMPNTSVQIGEGCIIYTPNSAVTKSDLATIELMLSPLGLAKEVPEQLINPLTGVAGCGPAFVYTIIEGLADGALKQGVPKEMAVNFAAQTLLGASKTLLLTKKHPAVLRDEVCSPGGSTIVGVHELEKGNIRSILMNAVEKSVEKSAALGKSSSEKSQ
ncbi:pyrroline-5-carboxylate reductase 3 [Condylostylus longicornis]|uniref:pyrroline-5-carboxylate reductase 3 n=1 Tax=Condylostylus longicornis TaxID=2530218 RepID=UPI00244E1408|nr:pyrroline-5-carboxylate reductase 3 [Condylostylus longicornis]